MKIQGVIFDMDGTMFDTERISCLGWEAADREFGLHTPRSFMLSCMGLPSEAIRQKVLDRLGADFDYTRFRERKIAHMVAYTEKHGIPLKPGLEEILAEIKKNGQKCAVATSTSRERAMYHIEKSGLLPYFSVILCGDQIAHGKPHPDIYLRAAALLGVSPAGCMALEDSKNGILSAHRAGMFAVLIPDMIEPDAEMRAAADVVLPSLAEAIPYLAQE